jgi:GNAT superfamily N-acetyltransferase
VEPLVRELLPGETRLAYRAMLELRPGLGSESEFIDHVQRLQRPEGFRLVGAFLPGDEEAAAAAGFRTGHFLVWGHVLYCDDLSTRSEYRGRGLAGSLLDWLFAEGERLGCDQLHLDSGTGADRQAAHRLYLNKRLRISAHHFSRLLR